MLRNSLIAISLLAASAGAMASDDDYIYGRVVTVEPHFSISFGGGGHHDGFRILYESGGQHYWTHSRHRPGHVIWVPRPIGHNVQHHKHHRHHGWHGRRDDHRDDHHYGRHDDRHDDRGTWERHGRDGRRGHHGRY